MSSISFQQGVNETKPITTILAAASADDLSRWMRTLHEAIAASGGRITRSATLQSIAARQKVPSASAHLDQLKMMDDAKLMQHKPKKLREVLDHMHVDFSDVPLPKVIPSALLNPCALTNHFSRL